MTGNDIPYHLRPNKFVERQLFFEILEHVSHFRPIGKYAYISMGGKYLEDFRLIHDRFGIKNLFSLEIEEWVCQRQKFNQPISLIGCEQMTAKDFIVRLEGWLEEKKLKTKNLIVWLDYTRPGKRYDQLVEFGDLINKLEHGDIAKITMNASSASLAQRGEREAPNDYQKRVLEELKKQLGEEYFSEKFANLETISARMLPQVLVDSIHKAILRGMNSKTKHTFFPLGIFTYNDGNHQLITFTGIVLNESLKLKFLKASGIEKWKFFRHIPDLTEIHKHLHEIDIPDLSLRERYAINAQIFSKKNLLNIQAKLGFQLAETVEKSVERINSYKDHYRQYPSYLRADV